MSDRNIFLAPYRDLGEIFSRHGHELYLVGGSVRDSLLSITPKDFDFATSATPDQQIAIYEAEGLRWIATGLTHGTLTLLWNAEPLEITTFRIDRETDGRHATVEFTRDIRLDLSRRDLSINAMAMDFNGDIIDPFGGEDDLKNGIIRFVGNPDERITEDYLRIMRYFRFYGRFGRTCGEDDVEAIRRHAAGLQKVSVERIWMELSKIMANTNTGESVLRMIEKLGVDTHGLRMNTSPTMYRDGAKATRDPAMLLGFTMGALTERVCAHLKLSNVERDKALFAAKAMRSYNRDMAEDDLLNGRPRCDIIAALLYHGLDSDATAISAWVVPMFPVGGDDLLAAGWVQGREMGQHLKALRAAWVKSGYEMTRDDLMGLSRV